MRRFQVVELLNEIYDNGEILEDLNRYIFIKENILIQMKADNQIYK